MKKGTLVKIIECDCTFNPLEHNGYIGTIKAKTYSGHYVDIPYEICIAKKVKKQSTSGGEQE